MCLDEVSYKPKKNSSIHSTAELFHEKCHKLLALPCARTMTAQITSAGSLGSFKFYEK